MEDIAQQEFWILVCSFLASSFWIWFNFPHLFYHSSWFSYHSPPLQDVSVAKNDDQLTTIPPAPPRPRPAPKYITLADLAKKIDKTWLRHYPPGYGMSAQTTAVANYPTRNFYSPPAIQRGRWVDLSAAAGPPPPSTTQSNTPPPSPNFPPSCVPPPPNRPSSRHKGSRTLSARASLLPSSSRGQRAPRRIGRALWHIPTTR